MIISLMFSFLGNVDLRRRFLLEQRPLADAPANTFLKVRMWIISDGSCCSKLHRMSQKWFSRIEQRSLLICILFVKLLAKLTLR